MALIAVFLLAQTWAPAAVPGEKLLVIGPAAFEETLKPFVAFKQQTIATRWHSLEKILSASAGVDDPERLKQFLYHQWRDHGLSHVLLVGDIDIMPVRYMVLDRVTAAAQDYAFYPSDLYYADLAKADKSFETWNAQRSGFHAGYFGEVRGEKNKADPINYDQIDYLPEIAVGRWPVTTPEEAWQVADKTIRHEKLFSQESACPGRAAFISVGGWVDTRSLLDRLASKMGKGWQIEKLYYSDEPSAPTAPIPNHTEVRRLFNQGLGLALHTGHGQPDAWEQCFSLKDLDHITNTTHLPIVVSAGCSTATFAPLPPYHAYVDVEGAEHAGTDHGEVFKAPPPPPAPYQCGRYNLTGLGEQLLKKGANGAVAYIGCNTGSQPCGLTLAEGFINAVASTKHPRLGDCWNDAVRFYHRREKLATLKPDEDWYPPSIFFQAMKFMVFGDPTLRLPSPEM
ncbi:MAG TPA: C25 family cysteine peptidase [Clostridia bacterium]|nr:C25 family cysteine peptidase [Clostridia bacterium]